MDKPDTLRELARTLGVHTEYVDGLGRSVDVSTETLLRVCSVAGGIPVTPADVVDVLQAHRAHHAAELLPPVIVAYDGLLPDVVPPGDGTVEASFHLEDGSVVPLEVVHSTIRCGPLPFGYHRLNVARGGHEATATVIAAPMQAWHRADAPRSWGIGAQLGALRSARSQSMADLRDLGRLCDWVSDRGGDLVTVLPLLPTFNALPPEASPYSPVSRLFWSELILDVGDGSPDAAAPATLDVTRRDAEIRAALSGVALTREFAATPELQQYARFRGAQQRHGRNWRDWPAHARGGLLRDADIDAAESHFHLVAQSMVAQQLAELHDALDRRGMRLGLDLAVGAHPDGYDAWSRQNLFGEGIAVGAPPDAGFPSGQDWGFAPVIPAASRRQGHDYLVASIAHQASVAGLLRIDHIMAWSRLYWIPHGFDLHQGTYVSYPADELFAILTLESHRHRCEIAGENLGTVPPEIDAALQTRQIWGMYLAEFQASAAGPLLPPTSTDMALVGSHDTPTFAGWLTGADIAERVQYGLLAPEEVPGVQAERGEAIARLARGLGHRDVNPRGMFADLLRWLGLSPSPLVCIWLEDLWLEVRGVNLPGTGSTVRPNWQRPMSRLLDDVMTDPNIDELLARLDGARRTPAVSPETPSG